MEELPPDPLLTPGSFIDPTTVEGGLNQSNPSTPIHDPDGATPMEEGNQTNTDSEVPDWLPPGWKVDFRVRTSGASAGHTDKYYYHPDCSRRFRSRKEVQRFLESGEMGSNKKKEKLDGADAKDTTPKPSTKRKKASPKVNVNNFKFDEPPAKVKWVLTDVKEDSWSPFFGDETKVPEREKKEWEAAYNHLSLQQNKDASTS